MYYDTPHLIIFLYMFTNDDLLGKPEFQISKLSVRGLFPWARIPSVYEREGSVKFTYKLDASRSVTHRVAFRTLIFILQGN